MTSLSTLSTDELGDGICLRAGRIAAAEAEMLPWIAEFDRREGWAGTGLLSCAHWLSWRIGLSLGAAREQVRVACGLEDLPQVAEAYGAGRISYSKVRAITRVAKADDGIDWVEHARNSTAAQLEKIVRGVRRAQANEAAESDPAAAAWQLRTRVRYDEHGNFSLTVSGPAEFLPVLQAGIEARKAELQRQHDAEAAEHVPAQAPAEPQPEPVPVDVPAGTFPPAELDEQAPGWPQGTTRREVSAAAESFSANLPRWREPDPDLDQSLSGPAVRHVEDSAVSAPATAGDVPAGTSHTKVTDAQALLAMAQDALAVEQSAHPAIARRRRPQLTAQIDPLSGWARQADGELLPPASLRAVMKTLPGRTGVLRLRPVTEFDLRQHDLGRTARDVSAALRELLGTLDGERCRFPGCTRHRKLHAHHVLYWTDGGGTDLDNLVLVCARHHTFIHAQGFRLVLHPDRRLEVTTAEGVPLLHHPAQPWADPGALAASCGRHVSAQTLPPDNVEPRLDLGYVISVLMAQAS